MPIVATLLALFGWTGELMSRAMANFLMCCAALFWGATFIAQKTGMETIGPMGFTFGRYVIGAAILLPLAIFEMKKVNLFTAMRQNRQICLGALGLADARDRVPVRVGDHSPLSWSFPCLTLTKLLIPATGRSSWMPFRNCIIS